MTNAKNLPSVFLSNSNYCFRDSLVTFKTKSSSSISLFAKTNCSYSRKPLNSLRFFTYPCLSTAPVRNVACVSIVPVEHPPPAPEYDFQSEMSRLKLLRSRLASTTNKDSVLDSDSRVRRIFFSGKAGKKGRIFPFSLETREMYLLKCLVAAGQEHVLGIQREGLLVDAQSENTSRSSVKKALYALIEMIERLNIERDGAEMFGGKYWDNQAGLKKLLKILDDIESFYDCIGGIIGYQIMVLELVTQSMDGKQTISNQSSHSTRIPSFETHPPKGLNLSNNREYASQAAMWGIAGLPDLGEIYPLGGSADRLGLVDPDTGECLPAAMLPYCGRTLLEGLIRDLQAREYLYFKLYGRQCITPVAIMTSGAKNNHERITSLCEKHEWFDRDRSNFTLFEQPLVPTISAEDATWLISKDFVPVCKPGGHGVIWKLAYNKGIFDWFHNHGRKGAIVRQVSNVVAATDVTLLALAGIGLRHEKKLGFASCQRSSGATEGINVILEKKNLNGEWSYGISCIEYTEFDKYEIATQPPPLNCSDLQFPANTNILYVDLQSVEAVVSRNDENSLPGMVLNTKKPISFVDDYGQCHSVLGGRLECTMQNIADNFLNCFSSRCSQAVEENLDTFLVYNERRKVTSSAKRKRRNLDSSLRQTPEGSFLDVLRNAHELLSACNIQLPKIEGNEKYADSGPPFLILLHPALGPLWEVTRQKFDGGRISAGSELQIEASEILWKNVQVEGSLIVLAENIMGSTTPNSNGEPILQYGHRCGRCRLENVNVLNQGIDWTSENNVYWKHEVRRAETCKILLKGNAEFEARNVTLESDLVFEVPSGYKMVVTSGVTGLDVQLNHLDDNMGDTGSWYWDYKISGAHIQLELVELPCSK